MEQEIDRIECAIRHIESSLDVDPWACEIAVNAMRELIKRTRGWISVSEALPEDGVTVWVTIKGYDVISCEEGETLEQAIDRINKIRWVTRGYWSDEEHAWNDPSFGCPLMVQPIAWMPINRPEPYEPQESEVKK